MRTILRGIESETLELDGVLSNAPPMTLPAPLEPASDPPAVNVLFFAMHGLGMRGVPWPAFDYTEALWRMAVRFENAPAWLAIACDIDRPFVRALGRRIVRYPTREARFGKRWSVDVKGDRFEASVVEGTASPAAHAARRTFVRDAGRLYEIPWEELAAPERRVAQVQIASDSLGERTFGARVTWSPSGLVLRGRTHMCGVARAVGVARA